MRMQLRFSVTKSYKHVGQKGITFAVGGSGYDEKYVNLFYATIGCAREIPQGA